MATSPKTITVGALTLTFTDLPGTRHSEARSDLTRGLHILRDSPKKWARLGDVDRASSVAQAITKGKLAGIEPGEFEAKSRRNVDGLPLPTHGRSYVYARYVGKRTRRTVNA